jgi:hypothetical protein
MPATTILRRINKREGTGCLEWLGYKSDRGYGLMKVGGKHVKAHRVAYELFMGEIPEGKEVHHVCGNKACVNPKHMELVDKPDHLEAHRGENLWLVNADKTHCINGHEYTPENTYRRPNGHRDCRICIAERVKRWRERHFKEVVTAKGGRGVEIELEA